MRDAEDILAELRAEGEVLKQNGAAFSVARVERAIADLTTALVDYLAWVPEPLAIERGYTGPWLRKRFASWERQGYARRNPRNLKERQYRGCLVLVDATADAEAAAARRAAQEEAVA